MGNYFDVSGRWDGRPEDGDALARRFAGFLASLGDIDPFLSHWLRGDMRHRSQVPLHVTLPPSLTELRDWLEENPLFETRNHRKTQLGYSVHAHTPDKEMPFASLRLDANVIDPPVYWSSETDLVFLFSPGDLPDRYRIARQALLALVQAWDVDWAGVATGNFSAWQHPTGEPFPKYKAGWMVYLDKNLAERIAAPEDIAMETFANGAVLLTATEAFFDRRNHDHFVAAQRIQHALAPLNA